LQVNNEQSGCYRPSFIRVAEALAQELRVIGCPFRNRGRELYQAKMVRIPGLQRAHQSLEFRQASQILEANIFQEKRPARESSVDAPLQPLKGHIMPS